MNLENQLGLRWTIGDVSDEGFAALQHSMWGAWHLFGPTAAYAVCVNTVPLAEARTKVGAVPAEVQWLTVTRFDIPAFILRHLPAVCERVQPPYEARDVLVPASAE